MEKLISEPVLLKGRQRYFPRREDINGSASIHATTIGNWTSQPAVDQLAEAYYVVDDLCNYIGAMADRLDRLSCDRLVHSPSIGGGFGRTSDPADHRASTSRLAEIRSPRVAVWSCRRRW